MKAAPGWEPPFLLACHGGPDTPGICGGLAEVDEQVELGSEGLTVEGGGAEVKLLDGSDDAGVPLGGEGLANVNVLSLTAGVNGDVEADLGGGRDGLGESCVGGNDVGC